MRNDDDDEEETTVGYHMHNFVTHCKSGIQRRKVFPMNHGSKPKEKRIAVMDPVELPYKSSMH